jgi:hypothetical protein
MKKYIVVVCLFFTFSASAFSQASDPNMSIEDRVVALEKKVQELETQLEKISTTSTKPSNRPDGDTKTSTTEKPTDQEVASAIATYLKKSVPVLWAGNLMGGSNGMVKTLSIQKWGNYNDQYRYWPVNVRVAGTCTVDNIFSKETKSFDKTGDFKLKKDDYGNWTAEFVEKY